MYLLKAVFMLVGDQVIPNLMPFLQMCADDRLDGEGTAISYRLILVKSDLPRYNANASKIRSFLMARFPELIQPQFIRECVIDGHNLASILDSCRAAIEQLKLEASNQGVKLELIFNMNSGTKIMALATYPLATENAPHARLIYLNSHTNQILQLLPIQEPPVLPRSLQIALSVTEYLQAHGYSVQSQELYLAQPSISVLQSKFEAARILGQTAFETVQELRQAFSSNKGSSEAFLRLLREGQSQAQTIALLDLTLNLAGLLWQIAEDNENQKAIAALRDEYKDYKERHSAQIKLKLLHDQNFFPGGKWLEYYVFDCVQRLSEQTSGVKIGDVMAGIRLQQSANNKVSNELDIAFTWGQYMAVCSCKTGTKAESSWIYDLNDRARTLSPFCRKILICAGSEPSSDFRERAVRDHIHLISGTDLSNLALNLKRIISENTN